MNNEELKNETIEEENNGNNILNGSSHGKSFTDNVKTRVKGGALKKIIKKAVIKSVAISMIVIMVVYVVLQPLFAIYDAIKNLTLVNMGQTLPNADSSTYSTTSGLFSKIAGKIVSGVKAILAVFRRGN